MFSPTYISAVVVLLSQILPWIGIEIGSEALTTTVTTVLAIGGALVIMIRRRMKGDINMAGKHL